MRQVGGSPIWDIWASGGPFVGDVSAHGRVTYDPGWSLRIDGAVSGYDRGPVRYFTAEDQNPTLEVDIPNIKSINIDRSTSTDAASCTITIYNQMMRDNTEANTYEELGQPGYFTFSRGKSTLAQQRWDHVSNEWEDILTPNALLRTYEGYGGHEKTTYNAWNDGNLLLTGVWMIDEVRVRTDGMLEVQCRDVAKLLVDQQLFPPLIPYGLYPLSYANLVSTDTFTPTGGGAIAARDTTAGHPIQHAFENDPNTYWQSGPHASQSDYTWIEFVNNGMVDTVAFRAWAGNYQVYICVHDALTGLWVGEGFTAAPDGTAFVIQGGVPFEGDVVFPLGDTFTSDKIRLVFTNLWSGDNQPPFFAGVREYESRRVVVGAGPQIPGNFDDYADIVKELVLWSGWHLNGYESPTVYGNIEETGVPGNQEPIVILDTEMFDKRPVIDAINEIKEIVGYMTWVDAEGGFHFESPNIFTVGNNFDEDGAPTSFVPEIDERLQLTDYSATFSDRSARSEVIVGTTNPYLEQSGVTTVYTINPNIPGKEFLRGMTKPAMWINDKFNNATETLRMSEEIARRIGMSLRKGSVTCVANPAIEVNDQVRIFERQAAEAYIHYVQGVSTTHDLDTGVYMMTLTTHWMDDDDTSGDDLTNF